MDTESLDPTLRLRLSRRKRLAGGRDGIPQRRAGNDLFDKGRHETGAQITGLVPVRQFWPFGTQVSKALSRFATNPTGATRITPPQPLLSFVAGSPIFFALRSANRQGLPGALRDHSRRNGDQPSIRSNVPIEVGVRFQPT